jgi:signal transduction histidine kinase
VIHCRPDTGCTVLAVSGGPSSGAVAAGEQSPVEWEGLVTTVLATGRAASADIESPGDGGVRSAVAVPIVVDHTPWGAVLIVSSGPRLAADVETRVADFADLLSTAISNAETRRQLTASRARIVAATDEARRRVERDLHDGAQQRLVSLGLQLRTVEASLSSDPAEAKRQIADVIVGLTAVSHDLQEISRGIHPAILSSGGLGPALKTLARRSAVPVELHHDVDRRLPQAVEVAAYYVVAEALTNAAKHARASQVDVAVEMTDANLHVVIRDDGVGGADTGKGSGLIGLQDRVEALGGQMILSSQTGRGTSLVFDIPLRSND